MPEHSANRYVCEPRQLGGVRTGSLDHPQPLGGGSSRVALLETGGGLSATVALDRGGDVVDAMFCGKSLAWLSPNGLAPGNFAHHQGMDWLHGWAGGLLTTCGPLHIGGPDPDRPHAEGLHGHHHLTPAAVLGVDPPDLTAEQPAFGIDLRLDDTQMFGPHLQTQRRIHGTLGSPSFTVQDTVTNLGNQPAPHHQLYHLNLGHPLLAPGARLVLGGQILARWGTLDHADALDESAKRIPDVLDEHRGGGEAGFILASPRGASSNQHTVGLVNETEQLALSISYSAPTLEKLAVWQHFGPGSYVCGVEPYHGSLMPGDQQPDEATHELQPGESRQYRITFNVGHGPDAVQSLLQHDAPLTQTN